MKIYTKKGDTGMTSLFGGGSYPKDNIRIEAYGTVDEVNSIVGLAATHATDDKVSQILLEVQRQLFTVGSELASLDSSEEMKRGFIQSSHIQGLEKQIDQWEAALTPLKKFILPGGSPAAAFLHQARTVTRRAERQVVTLSHQDPIRPEVIQYLNRLSDWCFVLARYVNHQEGVPDILWAGILKTP